MHSSSTLGRVLDGAVSAATADSLGPQVMDKTRKQIEIKRSEANRGRMLGNPGISTGGKRYRRRAK